MRRIILVISLFLMVFILQNGNADLTQGEAQFNTKKFIPYKPGITASQKGTTEESREYTNEDEELHERYYPNRVIVKFKEDVNESAFIKEIFDSKLPFESFSPNFKQLDSIFSQIQIKSVERLFPEALGNIGSPIGNFVKNKISVSSIAQQIHSSFIDQYEKIKAKYPKRAARAPKDFSPPKIYQIYKIEYDDNIDPQKLANKLIKEVSHLIEYAHPDFIPQLDFEPNDPYYQNGTLWNMEIINAPSAWDIETGSPDIIMADVEGGADWTHEDLGYDEGRIILPNGESGTNKSDHGTYVSGIMGATGNNAKGVIGLSFDSKLMIIDDIKRAADSGADVINTSWGAGGISYSTCDSVDYAYGLGALVVASAGNDNQNLLIQAPAQCERAISVGATNSSDQWADFANYGVNLDITAPGECIASTYPNNTYGTCGDGTSYSAPHVTGLVALLMSKDLEDAITNLSLEQIRQIIRKTADKNFGGEGQGNNFNSKFGFGRIDANAALLKDYACECLLTSPEVNYYDGNSTITVSTDTYEDVWTIVEGEFDIKGTANCPVPHSISKYILDYGEGENPQSWIMIKEDNKNVVNNGVLGTLDVSSFGQSNGLFTLRLRVFGLYGEIYEDRMQFNIARALITNYPYESNLTLFSNNITLKGFARGLGFQSYHFEYSQDGTNWTRFTEDFTTPVDPLSDPENSFLLKDFNIQNVPLPGGNLYIKLVVEDSIIGKLEDIIKVYIDDTNFPFQEGWPQSMGEDARYGNISPVVADLDNDGNNEIITGYVTSKGVYIVSYTASGIEKFRLLLAKDGYSSFTTRTIPTIGDINGDGYQEIGLFASGSNYEVFFIIDKDGNILNSWKHKTFYADIYEQDFCFKTAAFADINKDGMNEVVYGTFEEDGISGRLYVVNQYGEAIDGFSPYKQTNSPIIKTPAVGDMDNDGFLEIVAKDRNGNIYAWNHDGTSNKFPLVNRSTHNEYNPEFTNLILADINKDNYIDIIDMYQYQKESGEKITYVEVHDRNGEIIWSHEIPYTYEFYDTIFYTIAPGDLENDHSIEVIVSSNDYSSSKQIYCGQIWVINHDGSPRTNFYPMNFCEDVDFYPGYPIIADIDGNGLTEIIQSTYGRGSPYIFAARGDGIKMEEIDSRWPIRKYGHTFVPLTIWDIDNDGDLELLYNESSSTEIKIWDIPKGEDDYVLHWPMFQHDPQHTGVFFPPRIEIINPQDGEDVTGEVVNIQAKLYGDVENGGSIGFVIDERKFFIGIRDTDGDGIFEVEWDTTEEEIIQTSPGKIQDIEKPFSVTGKVKKAKLAKVLPVSHTIRVFAYDENSGTYLGDKITVIIKEKIGQ